MKLQNDGWKNQQPLFNAHGHFPRLIERLLLRNRLRRVIGSARVVRRFVDSVTGDVTRLPAGDSVDFGDCMMVVVVALLKASLPVDVVTEATVATTAAELDTVREE